MGQSNWSSYHYYSSLVEEEEEVRASQTPLDLVIGIASHHVLLGDRYASLIGGGWCKKIVHFLCINILHDQQTIRLISNWSKNNSLAIPKTETRFSNNIIIIQPDFYLAALQKCSTQIQRNLWPHFYHWIGTVIHDP